MKSRIFLDTNILVYCMDHYNAEKQKKCRDILVTLKDKSTGVISTQVVQEFYVVTTKKLKANPQIVKRIIASFEHLEIVVVNLEMINEAIDCGIKNNISFWDALIVIAAQSSKCEKIWTEDLNDGQIINKIRIENPMNYSRESLL